MSNNECYVLVPDLPGSTLADLQHQGFRVAKLRQPWTDAEKCALVLALRAWGDPEAMAHYGGEFYKTNGVPLSDHSVCLWLSRYALENSRSPAEVRLAIRKIKAEIPF
jgi:hypothetical protein